MCEFLSVLVCLQGPVCVSLPSVSDSAPLPAGHSGSSKAPGPPLGPPASHACPFNLTVLVGSRRAIFSSEQHGIVLSLRGALSWFSRPWSPNLSARSGVRRIGGAPFLVTEALESGAPMTAGLRSSLMSRGWEGAPLLEGVGEEKTGTPSPPTPLPPALPSSCLPPPLRTCIRPCSLSQVISPRKLNPIAPDSQDPGGSGWEGYPKSHGGRCGVSHLLPSPPPQSPTSLQAVSFFMTVNIDSALFC